jgi:hypothetical protein
MRLPHLVALAEPFELSAKSDDDVLMGNQNMTDAQRLPQRFRLKGDINWELFTAQFEGVPNAQLVSKISASLLQSKNNPVSTMASAFAQNDRLKNIRQIAIASMATPEYQLC